LLHLCDVNVLLSLVHEGQQFHAAAKEWEAKVGRRGEIGYSRATELSLLRLLNNPAVMGEDVRDGKGAWVILDELMLDERFAVVAEPTGLEEHLRALMPIWRHLRWLPAGSW
jgi:uncharacterized protein